MDWISGWVVVVVVVSSDGDGDGDIDVDVDVLGSITMECVVDLA